MKSSTIQRNSSDSPGGTRRFPTLRAAVSAGSLFALVQAGFILLRQQNFDVAVAVGLAKAGVVAAVATILILTSLAVLVRRWHPAAKQGDRGRATRSLLFGAVAALGTWMIVDAWVAGPLVPRGLGVWIEIAAALGVGIAVARRPPSQRFCRRTAFLALIAVAIVFAPIPGPSPGGRSSGDAEDRALPAVRDLSGAPDVVLISVDTFRVDRIGAYGSSLALTGQIDRFASEGFLFERAVASSPWTVPSMASVMTGLPTLRHGAGLPLGSGRTFLRSPLDADAVTLAERLSAAGYRTQAVVANGFLSPAMGLARGFDGYDTPFTRATGSLFLRDIPLARFFVTLFPVVKWADYRAQGVTDRALEILAEEADAPLFLWIHYIDLHTPFQADPSEFDLEAWNVEIHQQQPKVREDGTVVGDFFAGVSNVRGGMLWLDATDRERIRGYYDGSVAYVDGEVGRLFEAMRDSGRSRRLVTAFISDHGEEFWDHGHFEHGHDYYREVTRVPFVLWSPGLIPPGRVGGDPVGLVDLAPTLLELVGLQAPAAASPDEGVSLVSIWERQSPEGATEEAEVEEEEERSIEGGSPRIRFAEGNLYGMPSVLLEEGSWRFILRSHGAGELYHVADDPQELMNRVSEQPDLVARYRSVLEPRLALLLQNSGEEAPEIDAETKRALQALGYLQ